MAIVEDAQHHPQEQPPANRGTRVRLVDDPLVFLRIEDPARVRTQNIQIARQATLEVRALLHSKGRVLLDVVGRGAEVLEVRAGPARKDEDALADPVLQLALPERSILHRREQILQPLVLARVELVPEDDRRSATEDLVPDLMQGIGQLLGSMELRQVEHERWNALAERRLGDLLDAEGLA